MSDDLEKTEQEERKQAEREVDEWIAERDISTLEFRPGDVWGSQLVDDLVAGRIIAAWTRSTPEGAELKAHYSSPGNRGAIRRAFETLQLPISFRSLTEVFASLKASGKLEYIPSGAERAKAERESRQAEYRRFYNGASMNEIKQREKEDGGFAEWLKGRVIRETAPPKPLPPDPQNTAALAEAAGATKPPRDLSGINPELIAWVRDIYTPMPAWQLRAKLQSDAEFVRKTEQAAAAGLI